MSEYPSFLGIGNTSCHPYRELYIRIYRCRRDQLKNYVIRFDNTVLHYVIFLCSSVRIYFASSHYIFPYCGHKYINIRRYICELGLYEPESVLNCLKTAGALANSNLAFILRENKTSSTPIYTHVNTCSRKQFVVSEHTFTYIRTYTS